VFEFGVFHYQDLESSPGSGPDFVLTGRVHANRNLYLFPTDRRIVFGGDVTATLQIFETRSPSDSRLGGNFGGVRYLREMETGVNTLFVPTGGGSPHGMIELPPAGESVGSGMGRLRLYNKADLIILVRDSDAVAFSGAYNSFATSNLWSQVAPFVRTNFTGTALPLTSKAPLYDSRENRFVQLVEVDVQALAAHSATLQGYLGRYPNTLYVADLRSTPSDTMAAVRVVNGQTLPEGGLTLITPNPLYIKGHFNAPAGVLGTTNTAGTRPAAFAADAITLLSPNWDDSKSVYFSLFRNASDTTVNAALLGGATASTNGHYGGGLENFPRLMESWTGRRLNLNGSLVILFPSQVANSTWGSSWVYSAPAERAFRFDPKHLTPEGLPRGSPEVRALIRMESRSVGTPQP
jgi:hypothetical protein